MTEKERKKWDRKGLPKKLMSFITSLQDFFYKASKGKLWSTVKDCDISVVHMKGAITGKKRVVPLMHTPYDNCVILVASLDGADVHPTWYWQILVRTPK